MRMRYPFIERGKEEYSDICPFIIFGSLNKSITQENRITIIKEYRKTFNVNAKIPTGFD